MQKLKRNINMSFRVTQEEYNSICKRMEDVGISNQRAYLLKMALNGYVLNLDLADVRECARLLGNVSGCINQIAKRVNTTGDIYSTDMDEIKSKLNEVWEQQNSILRNLAKILEVA